MNQYKKLYLHIFTEIHEKAKERIWMNHTKKMKIYVKRENNIKNWQEQWEPDRQLKKKKG